MSFFPYLPQLHRVKIEIKSALNVAFKFRPRFKTVGVHPNNPTKISKTIGLELQFVTWNFLDAIRTCNPKTKVIVLVQAWKNEPPAPLINTRTHPACA